jgi:hypothetical protein
MDEMLDSGAVDMNSTKDYLARTPGILTILQTECTIYLKQAGAKVDTLDAIKNMTQDVELDDDICMGVLPYGLAARLLGQEDASLSNYFSSLYDEKLGSAVLTASSKYIAKQEQRPDVYSSLLRAGD